MSARNVCSGTVPSEKCSIRDMSAPFSRPATWTLIPLAPARIVRWMACFIARRKAIRFSSCWAMSSPTSLASKSGFLISTMLMCTRLPVRLFNSFRSFSTSEPPLPITIPGLAVWIEMLTRLAARSISICEIEALANLFRMNFRIRKSSCKLAA